MKETYVHNHKVNYEDDAQAGIDYLRIDLDANEAEVFFSAARRQSSVNFEDDNDRHFILTHNSSDNTYLLKRKKF